MFPPTCIPHSKPDRPTNGSGARCIKPPLRLSSPARRARARSQPCASAWRVGSCSQALERRRRSSSKLCWACCRSLAPSGMWSGLKHLDTEPSLDSSAVSVSLRPSRQEARSCPSLENRRLLAGEAQKLCSVSMCLIVCVSSVFNTFVCWQSSPKHLSLLHWSPFPAFVFTHRLVKVSLFERSSSRRRRASSSSSVIFALRLNP